MDKSNVTQLHPKDKNQKEEASLVSSLSPREIVSELDRFVVGQNKAKRAVAVALRNRWRRQALKGEMKNEVLPKNILMIGPTGVGKTEISRRLSKLAEAPFVKVEATRFTEVGYVGRDVEQIVRDLIEIAISMEKVKKRKEVFAQAQKAAEEKVLDALVGKKASLATRESFRKRLRSGDLDDNEIEIAVSDTGSGGASFEIPGMPGANVGMINIGEMIGKSMGNKEKKKKMTVKESHEILINDESDKLIEQDKIIKAAKLSTENNGIVFLDEIDKISARTDRVGGDVSREGVQRDLLPLIEGTTVNTKHGPIKTDHILFIASGAFQLAKPSDLLPELQGRLPIRVELEALTSEDFKRILREPDFSLIKQYVALLKTENVDLEFSDDGIDAIANIASEVNATVENIGARRLHTIIEKILDEISFTATDRSGEKIVIDKEYINQNLDTLVKDTDNCMAKKSSKKSFSLTLRNYFITGVVVLIPIGFTLYLTKILIGISSNLIPKNINPNSYLPFNIPGVEIVISILLITIVGGLSLSFFGRRILKLIDDLFKRIPFLRTVYSAIVQMTETFSKKDDSKKSVVLVEYPRKGAWAVGFATKENKGEMSQKTGKKLINVFVPTTPNPTSGFLLMFPIEDVIYLNMSFEEASKFIVSAGTSTKKS